MNKIMWTSVRCNLGCISLLFDANWFINLDLQLRRSIKLLHPGYDDKPVVEFDVTDRRWNDNSYLWMTLINIIRDFKNSRDRVIIAFIQSKIV